MRRATKRTTTAAANGHARAEALEERRLFAITFGTPNSFPVAGFPITEPAVADLNGDGLDDVVTADSDLGQSTLSVLLNVGGGNLAPQPALQVGGRPYQVVAVDVDHDGDADLICANLLD